MPEVIGLSDGDEARRCVHGRSGLRESRRTQHPADCRRSEVQTRAGENPGDSDSSHGGAEHFQPPYNVPDEFGEPIHRFR